MALLQVSRPIEEVEAASANQFEATATGGISYQVKNWEGKLEKFYREWRKYGDAMLLDWGDLPDLYRNKFNNIVEAKQRAWNDPYAVERRERARARKAAKKALGVE